MLFGAERFASVFFVNHSRDALKNLFIQGYTEPEPFNFFSKPDLASAIVFAKERVGAGGIVGLKTCGVFAKKGRNNKSLLLGGTYTWYIQILFFVVLYLNFDYVYPFTAYF